MDFGEWDKKQIDLFPLCKEYYRVCKNGETCIIWYDLWKTTILTQTLLESDFKQLRFIE